MTDPIIATRKLTRDRSGPSITLHTLKDQALLSATGSGCHFSLHFSPAEVLGLVELLSESALLMAKDEVAA